MNERPGIPQLETARLILRAFREQDFEPYAEICANPEVMQFLRGEPLPRDEAWRQMAFFLGHWQLLGYGIWAVEEKATGALVGRVGFLNPAGWPDFELAWTLARQAWGQGYATEAGRAALAFAFERLRRPRVISLIVPDNVRSIAVAERLGEKVNGMVNLHGRDVRVYEITRDDWLTRRARDAAASQ